ncbi:ferritin-like domain-containing protein [Nannocystis sp. ILAH1]|uniref:ferritin-like domain-containing protein n=1 Tax=unclassified Nannocystis TaxID=2627009 RepID=UPI0022703A02|nr:MULTISPECIES: ferritin-like domain-containing protein [unclassified Nannocystis]MCY0992856.1 ferritin-like domain-containing protein [Nannocystis sp. ILAH1]MCY1066306.1 ferritin-like domain-containing protein [Nannocystis sp. RBIL2]
MNRARRPTDLALNRTGIYLSPTDGPAVVEGARDAPSSPGCARALAEVRRQYAGEVGLIGHMPAPASLRVVENAGGALLRRHKVHLLLDKLGERLAFERTGVRLFDALMAKLEAQGSWDRGPTLEELAQFRADEAHHFAMLQDVLINLGADPTAVTPSADLAGVELAGIVQVVSDPRTTLPQALHAHLVAELVDSASWEQLVGLADDFGEAALAHKLREPLAQELRHRDTVTTWLKRHAALVVGGTLKYSA